MSHPPIPQPHPPSHKWEEKKQNSKIKDKESLVIFTNNLHDVTFKQAQVSSFKLLLTLKDYSACHTV